MIGTKLAHYEITSHLGTGGMGEVYQATDSKLGRSVAIKLLPEAFAQDAESVSRFNREARVLASLNHPNIAVIHGIEQSGGRTFLVMELADGETLAERIKRGAIPVPEALGIAREIAEGLEAAHEKGIIHRDLKPANVKIAADGKVKVLDFGLAKAYPLEPANVGLSDSPTISMAATNPGTILGTAAYMSPEQANGGALDRRTDIFAFGALLFEMLTGRRAFPGETFGDILAAVIRAEPDWTKLPAATPSGIRRLLRRCLQKNRNERLQTAGDARIEIDDVKHEPQADLSIVPTARRWRESIAWILAVVTIIAAVGVVWFFRPPPATEMRLELTTPPSTDPQSLAISPDGQKVVFVAAADGHPRLWLRSLSLDKAARPLTGTNNAAYPFWSPDSSAVAFFSDGKLMRINLDSGSVQTLADAIPRGGTWSPDGVILFAPTSRGGLFQLPASGGAAPVELKQSNMGISGATFPYFLPGGREFLFHNSIGPEDTRGLYLGSRDDPQTKRLTAADTAGAYLSPGWLLFMRQGTLVAQRFDASRKELRGDPVTVADHVSFDSSLYKGAFSVSAAGLVIYRASGGRQLTWFDRSGKPLGTMGGLDENDLIAPELSPDGQRAMVQRTVQGNTDLWLIDGARTVQFTSDAAIDRLPVWSPDGSLIVFASSREGARNLYQKPLTGDDNEVEFLTSLADKAPNSWSTDGRYLLYTTLDPKTGADLWVKPLDGDRKPYAFLNTSFDERAGQFSPDGHWVAYQSNESEQRQIFVRPFPGPGARSQVSPSGGIQTRWSSDGKELYYIAPDGNLVAVPITVTGGRLETGAPVILFKPRIWGGGTNAFNRQQYDVTRDGRFLINVTTENDTNTPITFVLNWKPPVK